MAYELDSEMREGLRRQYAAMSDGELLDMAARPGDLTDMTQEVLRAEIEGRRLEVGPAEPLPDPFGLSRTNPLPKPEFGTALERGKVVLITLYDGIAAGEACDHLEEAGIDVEVRDLSETAGRGSFYGGAPIALQLIVNEPDRDRAVKVLREKLGLFPLEGDCGSGRNGGRRNGVDGGAVRPARGCRGCGAGAG